MTIAQFRRCALSFPGAEEGSHMGVVDFRVGGRVFATLAMAEQGYGNLMLDLADQAALCEEMPGIFLPVAGGWGRMGITHIVLKAASKEILQNALGLAYRRRLRMNERGKKKPSKRSDHLDLDQRTRP